MQGITGKSVIVTGGSDGIGRAAAMLLATHGARITIGDVNVEDGKAVVEMIRAAGGDACFSRCDISDEEDVRNLVDLAVATFGSLNGAFNNAGVPLVSKRVHELSLSDWRKCLSINLDGTFLCIKYEVEQMLKFGGGAIVNTASIASFVNVPFGSEYVASKHGVAGLTKAAACDYGHDNIRVNAVAPGSVQTKMLQRAFDDNPDFEAYCNDQHPIGRFAQPNEIAEAVLWLLSDASSFVTGAILPVDGGFIAV
jgi:2,5-dichloro-2,5-cyclohexadiene-1,4-diol dehydrogenase 1